MAGRRDRAAGSRHRSDEHGQREGGRVWPAGARAPRRRARSRDRGRVARVVGERLRSRSARRPRRQCAPRVRRLRAAPAAHQAARRRCDHADRRAGVTEALGRALPHHQLRPGNDLRRRSPAHRARRHRDRPRHRAGLRARRVPHAPAHARRGCGAVPPCDPRHDRPRRGHLRRHRRLSAGPVRRAAARDRARLPGLALAAPRVRGSAVPHARRLPSVQPRVRRHAPHVPRREPRWLRGRGRRPHGARGELHPVRDRRAVVVEPRSRRALASLLGRVSARATRHRPVPCRAAVLRVANPRRLQPHVLSAPRQCGSPRAPRLRARHPRRRRARTRAADRLFA